MKIKLDITKNSLFVLIVVVILLSGIFVVNATVDTSLPYHDATQIRMTDDRNAEETIADLEARLSDLEVSCGPSFQPGDSLLGQSYTSDGECITPTSYTKVKELEVVDFGGEVKVSFDLMWFFYKPPFSGDTDKTSYARLYRNDNPVGSVHSTDDTDYKWFSENVEVSPGDRIELRIKTGYPDEPDKVGDFIACNRYLKISAEPAGTVNVID